MAKRLAKTKLKKKTTKKSEIKRPVCVFDVYSWRGGYGGSHVYIDFVLLKPTGRRFSLKEEKEFFKKTRDDQNEDLRFGGRSNRKWEVMSWVRKFAAVLKKKKFLVSVSTSESKLSLPKGIAELKKEIDKEFDLPKPKYVSEGD